MQVVSVSGDLVLNRGHPGWWSFHDTDAPSIRGCGTLAGPMAIVISEETPRKFWIFIMNGDLCGVFFRQFTFDKVDWIRAEGILGETLSKFSIWGLYITFVLAVGRFIRLQCADLRMRIPYENLPSCDRYLSSISFHLCISSIHFVYHCLVIGLVVSSPGNYLSSHLSSKTSIYCIFAPTSTKYSVRVFHGNMAKAPLFLGGTSHKEKEDKKKYSV